jgi:hypothetical protein
VDVNRGACSLPLHIACFKGYKELVELMVNKYRARVDLEFRMCWPGIHNINCEERSKHHSKMENVIFFSDFNSLEVILKQVFRLQVITMTTYPVWNDHLTKFKVPFITLLTEITRKSLKCSFSGGRNIGFLGTKSDLCSTSLANEERGIASSYLSVTDRRKSINVTTNITQSTTL